MHLNISDNLWKQLLCKVFCPVVLFSLDDLCCCVLPYLLILSLVYYPSVYDQTNRPQVVMVVLKWTGRLARYELRAFPCSGTGNTCWQWWLLTGWAAAVLLLSSLWLLDPGHHSLPMPPSLLQYQKTPLKDNREFTHIHPLKSLTGHLHETTWHWLHTHTSAVFLLLHHD